MSKSILERAAEFLSGAKDVTESGERQDERAMKLLGSLACDFNLSDSVKTLREAMELQLGGKKSLAYKRENSRVSMCVKSIEYFGEIEIPDYDGFTLAQLWADEVYPFGSLRDTYNIAQDAAKPKASNAERLGKLMRKMTVSEVTKVYQTFIDSIAGANQISESAQVAKLEKIHKFRRIVTAVTA